MDSGSIAQLIFSIIISFGFVLLIYALIRKRVVPAYIGAALSVPISVFFSGYEELHYMPLIFPFLNMIGCKFIKNSNRLLASIFFSPYIIGSFIIIFFGLILDVW